MIWIYPTIDALTSIAALLAFAAEGRLLAMVPYPGVAGASVMLPRSSKSGGGSNGSSKMSETRL